MYFVTFTSVKYIVSKSKSDNGRPGLKDNDTSTGATIKISPLFYCYCFCLEKFQQNLRAIFYISILCWPETFYSTIPQFLSFVSDSLKAPTKM